MPSKASQLSRVVFLCLAAFPALAQQQARVDQFSPQGTVKNVRQVHARFSEPMVPLGDPRPPENPFVMQCPEKGTGRWVDGRNWVFDFDRNLPAGIRCEFRLRDGLKTLAGNSVGGPQQFVFSTGGPAILSSRPFEGSDSVDDEQIFLLELDSETVERSVLANTSFTVEKVPDRIGVRIVTGEPRDAILRAEYPRAEYRPPHTLLIQAVRRFPAGARVSLVWGRGISAPGGVATETDQVLPFIVRTPFTASFHCQRENSQAECVPVSPMRLYFSAPVLWIDVRGSVLKGSGGKRWSPKRPGSDEEEDARFVTDLRFEGPFPERSAFTIEIPAGLKDDSGRSLSNAGAFPITVRTDEYPPLAKFSADFGILEWKGNPLLPVTLRNVEADDGSPVSAGYRRRAGCRSSRAGRRHAAGRGKHARPGRAGALGSGRPDAALDGQGATPRLGRPRKVDLRPGDERQGRLLHHPEAGGWQSRSKLSVSR